MRSAFLAAAAAATALLACLGGTNAQACPAFLTKGSIRKTVVGGKSATLTVRVRNHGDAVVNDAGLGLTLPSGVTFKSVSVSPKLASVPALQTEGDMLVWTGIPIDKTCTFRIKLAVDKCAGNDAVAPKKANAKNAGRLFDGTIGVATFTGPAADLDCLASRIIKVSPARDSWLSGV